MSITITNAKLPVFTKTGSIDLQIEVCGEWLPFTASVDDKEAHGRDLYNRAMAGDFGTILDYTEITPSKKVSALEDIISTEKAQTPRGIREAILELADRIGVECEFLRSIEEEIAKKRIDLA